MKYKIFTNNKEISNKIKEEVSVKLSRNNFIYNEEDYDLAIAIGGDGSFLHMVKDTNFNTNILYVGINAGTLGFAQEISIDNIDNFIEDIKKNNYKVDYIGIEEIKVNTNNSTSYFNALNEIVVRDKELNTLLCNVMIDNSYLEKFIGDGLLISTSFGSTAYNLSFGGAIIYNTFHTLEITPIAPLNNKAYRTLLNSVVVPSDKKITLIPDKKSLLITIDGENNYYDDISSIEIYMENKTIKCYRNIDYDFCKKINEKFLK